MKKWSTHFVSASSRRRRRLVIGAIKGMQMRRRGRPRLVAQFVVSSAYLQVCMSLCITALVHKECAHLHRACEPQNEHQYRGRPFSFFPMLNESLAVSTLTTWGKKRMSDQSIGTAQVCALSVPEWLIERLINQSMVSSIWKRKVHWTMKLIPDGWQMSVCGRHTTQWGALMRRIVLATCLA